MIQYIKFKIQNYKQKAKKHNLNIMISVLNNYKLTY